MTCRSVIARVNEFLDCRADPMSDLRIADHTGRCPRCRRAIEGLARLRQLAAPLADCPASRAHETAARVMAAVSQYAQRVASPRRTGAGLLVYASAGVAGALVLGVFLGFHLGSRPGAPGSAPGVAATDQAVAVGPEERNTIQLRNAGSNGDTSVAEIVKQPTAAESSSPPAPAAAPTGVSQEQPAVSGSPPSAERQPIIPRGRSRIGPKSPAPAPRGDVQPVGHNMSPDPSGAKAPGVLDEGRGGRSASFAVIEPGHENDGGPRTLVLIVPGQGL